MNTFYIYQEANYTDNNINQHITYQYNINTSQSDFHSPHSSNTPRSNHSQYLTQFNSNTYGLSLLADLAEGHSTIQTSSNGSIMFTESPQALSPNPIETLIIKNEKLSCKDTTKYKRQSKTLRRRKAPSFSDLPSNEELPKIPIVGTNEFLKYSMDYERNLYLCEESQCYKGFKSFFGLKSHATTHSDYHPYQCDQCTQKFRRNQDLNRHKKTHTDEKPFACPNCDAHFARKDAQTRHTNRFKCKRARSVLKKVQEAII